MDRSSWYVGALILQLVAARSVCAQMVLSGNPQTLSVSTAVAGFAPDPVMNESTFYNVTIASPSNIVAKLDAPLPPGVTLRVRLVPPPGASGHGMIVLTTDAQVLVSSIPIGNYTALGITYELSAAVSAGVIPLNTRQVTFSLVTAM